MLQGFFISEFRFARTSILQDFGIRSNQILFPQLPLKRIPTMIYRPSISRCFFFATLAFISLTLSTETWAQFPDGLFGPGGLTNIPQQGQPTQFPQQQFPQQGQGQGGQQQGGGQRGGQQSAQTSQGGLAEVDPSSAVKFRQITDLRNKGFVGVTARRTTDLGFVGPAGTLSGPALVSGATFGGGVNAGGGGAAGRARGAMGGPLMGGGQFGQFGMAGSQNFFEVARGGLRGAVQMDFAYPQYSNEQVATQFASNFSRLPDTQNFAGQYQVTVNDKKATVTGWVRSQADSDRLMAQLRLQPGVYSIENNLQIGIPASAANQ
jgi:hypothetical protein